MHVADVRVGPGARLCDSTRLHVEDTPPAACDSALRRTGASIRQDVGGRGGSEVVIDVLEPAGGLPWVGSQRPLRACLPRYAEKRGDVWQRAWRGEAKDLLFQVFEEDESGAGHGNSARAAKAPSPLVTTAAAAYPTSPVVSAGTGTRPGRPRRPAPPDEDRF